MKRGKAKSTKDQKKAEAPALLVNNPSKWQSWWVRFRLSVIMILGFGVIIWIGHWGLVGLLLFLQIFGYRELSNIRAITMFGKGKTSERGNIPYSSPWLDIAIFFSVQYFFYGTMIFRQFHSTFMAADTPLRYLVNYHSLICFTMMMCCLVAFVGTLEKSVYLQQFQYLTWSVMIQIFIIPSNFHVFNIFQGLFWFVLPVSLIVCNDITAYIWGFFLGRHSLIGLSPKKTWEGFIGAFFSTVVFSFFMAEVLSHFQIMVCPATNIFGSTECIPDAIFEPSHYVLPSAIGESLVKLGIDLTTVRIRTVQIYAIYFGIFASTVAPFGGFLASGFKRAYGFKDFGDLIPGHGGIVDRMDCQVMMSAFTFVFYLNIVNAPGTASSVMSSVLSLPLHQQLDLLAKLQATLG